MSFEFYGGLLVLDLLQKEGAKKEQAESVAEAVIRHQDLGTTGTLTTIGALIQFATIFGKWLLLLLSLRELSGHVKGVLKAMRFWEAKLFSS